MGFASKGYSDYPNRIGFETAYENPNKKNAFDFETKFQEIEKYKIRTNQRLRYTPGMRVEKSNRLSSSYECCCCCCCCCCCSAAADGRVRDLCCTAVMRRLSIDATGGRCAVCAWGVLCDVRVSPQSPKHKFFADRSRFCLLYTSDAADE